jgi:predicted ribosomally synthesized peptide with nif11-like leader
MSEEQLTALLAKLKDDAGLQEKLKGAADRDAAAAMMKEAGFGALLDVSKEDWLKYQANQTVELSDVELEGVVGGTFGIDDWTLLLFEIADYHDNERKWKQVDWKTIRGQEI